MNLVIHSENNRVYEAPSEELQAIHVGSAGSSLIIPHHDGFVFVNLESREVNLFPRCRVVLLSPYYRDGVPFPLPPSVYVALDSRVAYFGCWPSTVFPHVGDLLWDSAWAAVIADGVRRMEQARQGEGDQPTAPSALDRACIRAARETKRLNALREFDEYRGEEND